MNIPDPSAVCPLTLTWFNCTKIVEPESIAIGVLPGMKFKAIWRSVEQDIKVLSDRGITDVFCLCKQNELAYFRVRELFDAYRSKDIRVHHYPIEPVVSPDYKDIRNILTDLWNTVLDGNKVYIHARSLLGRVSVIVAAFYMELEEDVTSAHAIFKTRELIGNGAFQTMQQYSFVDGFRDYQAQYLSAIY